MEATQRAIKNKETGDTVTIKEVTETNEVIENTETEDTVSIKQRD